MKFNFFSSKTILVSIGLVSLAIANLAWADDTRGVNSQTSQYVRENKIDGIIETYYRANDLPGMSVAIIRKGEMIYRKGFGWADREEKEPARAETVYSIGSVSKPIGATLAVKLENEGRLRDGATFSLDLSLPTSDYLTDIPNANGRGRVSLPTFHTHTVKQLLSHTGCVAGSSGKTTPGIVNRTTHYATAISAVQSMWDTGLVTKTAWADNGPCAIGKTWSYSTPAFTFIAAALESATGRNIDRLLQEELLAPHGLSGIRIKYASPVLTPDHDRATPYDKDNRKLDFEDDSWRALGGGMEAHALDLARFGWKLLDGEILSEDVRDNRLWRRVEISNTNSPGYALGWGVTTDAHGRRIAEHPGMATGGRALLHIYRDHGLVIAILANRKEHPVGDVHVLAGNIGDEILR
uniref:CubicO group peptidase, beta-lactamase class C family n=1 Tax=Candidatus Kentrum sp. SD TaxID=2126332 RepID=A0A451BHR5_9GAMM|nr:MAG: CubicO group peptidase, beta-lactamase class C family [Candidatus Kentron sp. SD]